MSDIDEIKTAIAMLLEKARRSIGSAERIGADDPDSAVSCLYYAMFHCATALLLTKELGFSKHKGVIAAFAQHFVRTDLFPKECHRWLQDAFEKRLVSHYEFRPQPSEETVLDLKTKAVEFLAKTRQFLQRSGFL